MPTLLETVLTWISALLVVLGLLSTMIMPCTPDRWVFEAGYACVPEGNDLRLSPQRMRFGRFTWWSMGFGLCCLGLACLSGTPVLVGAVIDEGLYRWYEWLGLAVTILLLLGMSVLCGWSGRKLMRARWFAGPLHETRFYWRDGERRIDITTTRLLRQPVVVTHACHELDHLLIIARQSRDGGVTDGTISTIRHELVQLLLVFRNDLPIDLTGRINDGAGARRMIEMIATWCGVEVRQMDGLPEITPFNFDRS